MTLNLKIMLVAPLAIVSIAASAQMSNVQSAANSLKFKEFADAKKYIDQAADNEKTANDPKMWYYRGRVYLDIYRDKDLKVRNLDPDAAEKAAVSFLNCQKTDVRKVFHDDELKVDDYTWESGLGVFNTAVDAYNRGDYEKAFKMYDIVFQIFPYDKDKNLGRSNITPEAIYKNIYITAIKAKNNAKAKEYIKKLMDMNYNDPDIYIKMSRIYLEEKDTAKALAYIEKGKSLFENNAVLATDEINIYIGKKDFTMLLAKLTKAIEADPERDVLYYQRARVYEKKNDYEKSIADYKKAIELNKDNADAYSDLGVVIYNQGAEIIIAAGNIKSDMEYQKAKKRGEDKIKEALPYLEKAHELNPKDRTTLNALKQIYVRTNNTEKYNQTKAEIEALK